MTGEERNQICVTSFWMAHLLMFHLYFRDADDAVYDLNGSEFMGER